MFFLFLKHHHHQSIVNIEIGPYVERENDDGPYSLLIETKTDLYRNTYSEYRLYANSQYNNHIFIQFLSSCFDSQNKRTS
jgi:hypothetical protein